MGCAEKRITSPKMIILCFFHELKIRLVDNLQSLVMCNTSEASSFFFFLFNWDSLHATLNSHYEAWSYKKKNTQKRLQETENLFRKNLQLKDVC